LPKEADFPNWQHRWQQSAGLGRTMITDDELDDLSDDVEVAFVQFETIVRKSMEASINNGKLERRKNLCHSYYRVH
jgi:hypothetical protein